MTNIKYYFFIFLNLLERVEIKNELCYNLDNIKSRQEEWQWNLISEAKKLIITAE